MTWNVCVTLELSVSVNSFMTEPARCQIPRTVPEMSVPSSSSPRPLPVKSPASLVPGLRPVGQLNVTVSWYFTFKA